MRRLASALTFAALSLAAASAHANGRFPASGQVAVDPSDERHLVVRATYGLLSTTDAGKTWGWICEGAMGFVGSEDPMVAIMKDGTVLAGLFEGLARADPTGCKWSLPSPFKGQYVTDIAADKAHPEQAVLMLSLGLGSNKYKTQLWATTDNGTSWQQRGLDLPTDFVSTTVDTAPSDPSYVYSSGLSVSPYGGVFERSTDSGQTWTRTTGGWSDMNRVPFIGGVDAIDPKKVYLRMDSEGTTIPETVEFSSDAGDTWTTIYTAKGHLAGFALSPDGANVAIGGDKDGVWVAPTATHAFVQVSTLLARCLTWTTKGLYACADEYADGFETGLSTDGGKTFEGIGHLGGVCPLACDSGTSVGSLCPGEWDRVRGSIHAPACDEPAPEPGHQPPTATPPKSGGCAASGRDDAGWAAAAWTIGLGWAVWASRKRRDNPQGEIRWRAPA